MRSISSAFFHQLEITHVDRWDHGALELAFLPEPAPGHLEWIARVHEWNSTQRAGVVRTGEAQRFVRSSRALAYEACQTVGWNTLLPILQLTTACGPRV